MRLLVEQPQLGTGQLMRLAERVLGLRATRETFRQILIRRRDLVIELEDARRRRPRRIRVSQPGQLWGVALTLVWFLCFWPAWLLGAVDYHGSRLVVFERLPWPTAAAVTRALGRAFDQHGAPERLLTDRGPVFTAAVFADVCATRGVHHVRIRPGHCWTNGRIERVFRTFKQTVFGFIWLFSAPGRSTATASTSTAGATPTGRTPAAAAAPPTRCTSPGRSNSGHSAPSPTSTASSTGTALADDPRRRAVDPARRSVTTCSSVPLALVAAAVPYPGSATSRSRTT